VLKIYLQMRYFPSSHLNDGFSKILKLESAILRIEVYPVILFTFWEIKGLLASVTQLHHENLITSLLCTGE
jgi:hypothetical protein